MAKLFCPHCRQTLEVAQELPAGTPARCFVCRQVFVVGATPPPPAAPAPQPQRPAHAATQAPLQPLGGLQPLGPLQPLGGAHPQLPQYPAQLPSQPLYGAPATQKDDLPPWAIWLTVGAGGLAILVLLSIALMSALRPASHADTVALAPATDAPPGSTPGQPAPVASTPFAPTPTPTPSYAPSPAPTPSYSSPAPVASGSAPAPQPAVSQPAVSQPAVSPPPATTVASSATPAPASVAPPVTFPEPSSPSPDVPAPAADEPVPAPDSGEVATGDLVYKWRYGQRYSYNYQLNVAGSGQNSQVKGTIGYSSNAAETKSLRDQMREIMGGEATGTAFVVHPDGVLLTCDHVIRGASKIEVTLQGKKYFAKVVARDARHDLAILKIAAQGLPALALGDSSQVRLIETVYALGYPLSDLLGKAIKVTPGTVASLVDDERGVLQINAGINPGNSGGPILNARGEVVGVCNAKLVREDVSDVGFAVPVNQAKKLLASKSITLLTLPSVAAPDAPTLMEKTTPAVGFVEATLGADADKLTLLSFIGVQNGLTTNGQVLSTTAGDLLVERNSPFLPGLVSSHGGLVIDKLPEPGETTWETGSVSNITLESQSSGFEGFGAFRRPGLPRTSLIVAPVVSTTKYRLGARQGDEQTIFKEYELVILQPRGEEKLYATKGKGTVTFHVAQGVPTKSQMKYDFARSEGGSLRQYKVDFSYELGARESDTAFLARANQAAKQQLQERATQRAADDAAKAQEALARLKSGSVPDNELSNLLFSLMPIEPIESLRPEFAPELDKHLDHPNSSIRFAALRCVKKWGTELNVPKLEQLLPSSEPADRTSVVEALGALSRSPAVAEKLAAMLGDNREYYSVVSALKAMGPVAEDAALEALRRPEERTRLGAMEVLGDVGSQKAVAPLQAVANDPSNSRLRTYASIALRRLNDRLRRK